MSGVEWQKGPISRRPSVMAAAAGLLAIGSLALAACATTSRHTAKAGRVGKPATTVTASSATTAAPAPTEPSTSTTTAAAPAAPPTEPQLTLVAGPYWSLVPAGWTVVAMTNYGGSSRWATVFDPASSARLDYEFIGGSFGALYDQQGKPLPDALGTLGVRPLGPTGLGSGCPMTWRQALHGDELAYSCARTANGLQVDGVYLFHAEGQGVIGLQVTLPASRHATASQILNSLQ